MNFFAIIIGLLIFSNSSYADLVRISHYPAAMIKKSGKTYDGILDNVVPFTDWKISTAIKNVSPSASGFVVAVHDGIEVSQSLDSHLSYLYSNTSFKAVYILTNHHVWYNNREEMQAAERQLNPDPDRFSIMVATSVKIYDKNGKENFSNIYFPETHPINYWAGAKYNFSLYNMGVREIKTCLNDDHNYEGLRGLNLHWGCDFSLIRLIVPSDTPIEVENISQAPLMINDIIDVWFQPAYHSTYQIQNSIGEPSVFVADLYSRGYVPTSGWSGSPIINVKDGGVAGILYGGWPGANSKFVAYDINYVYRVLNLKKNIEDDFNWIRAELSKSFTLLKGNFYGKFENQRQ